MRSGQVLVSSQNLFHNALIDLPPGSTLILAELEGQFWAETAESLGISPKAVSVKIYRAQAPLGKNAHDSFFAHHKVFLRDRTAFFVGVSKHGSRMRDMGK